VSRSRIIELEPLSDEDVRLIVRRALSDDRGLAGTVSLDEDAESAIVTSAGGDARVALTTLELAVGCVTPDERGLRTVSMQAVREAAPSRILPYDKQGDVHYDVISAFIKSMRGSDPDAAVYWLARMIHGGEDPKFIARRMLIFASEDVGNADPQALLIAHAAFKSAESIGWPECRINLAQAATYLALAEKSNAAYVAIDEALSEVRMGPARSVPSHLRDRHRPGSEAYGPYRYPHDYPDARVDQQYLPTGLELSSFYRPSRGWEAGRDAARRAREDHEGSPLAFSGDADEAARNSGRDG